MLREVVKERIIEIIGQLLDLNECIVILFGSEALGKSTPRSDIDVGIDCTFPIPDEVFLQLEKRINEEVETLRRIDLVELRLLDEEFLSFALRGAIVWHVGRDYLKSWLKQKRPLKS